MLLKNVLIFTVVYDVYGTFSNRVFFKNLTTILMRLYSVKNQSESFVYFAFIINLGLILLFASKYNLKFLFRLFYEKNFLF